MTATKISIHNRHIETGIEAIKKWNISEEDKQDLLLFIKELGLGKVNRGKKISESRQLKYIESLKPILLYFKKSIKDITVKDMENFDLALSKNEIKRLDGKPYQEDTKKYMKLLLKIYLRWRFKDNPTKFIELTGWLDTRITKTKTPNFLTEDEILKLFKSCKNARERFLIAVLFDAGARAEEFFNIRFEDITLPNGANNYSKIALKEEYSKTLGRTFGLYWIYSNEAVIEYVNERRNQGIKPDEPIFDMTYSAARLFLGRFGKKVLNKSIHFHLFRHSSATYYASKLNRQELCYRYGWKFSSDMPDVYISRSGMMEKQVEDKFTKTDLSELQFKLQQQEQKFNVIQEKVDFNEIQNKKIAEGLKLFLEMLKENPEEVKAIVRKNKEKIKQAFS